MMYRGNSVWQVVAIVSPRRGRHGVRRCCAPVEGGRDRPAYGNKAGRGWSAIVVGAHELSRWIGCWHAPWDDLRPALRSDVVKCRGCKAGRGAGGHGVGGENESCQGVYADAVCCGRRCGAANLGLLPNCGVSGCGLAGDGVLAIAAAGVKTSMTGSEVTWSSLSFHGSYSCWAAALRRSRWWLLERCLCWNGWGRLPAAGCNGLCYDVGGLRRWLVSPAPRRPLGWVVVPSWAWA